MWTFTLCEPAGLWPAVDERKRPNFRYAGVVQWQNESFPSFRRGFDPLYPLHNYPVVVVPAKAGTQ